MAVNVDMVATLFLTGILGISAGALTVNYILDKKNIRDLNTKSEEAKKQYYDSMTSEDKAKIELAKQENDKLRLEVRAKEAEASKAKAESQKAVTKFKNDIVSDVKIECMKQVKEDTEDMFDDWVEKYESKEERKIDSLTNRVDNLADRINDSNSSKGNSSPVINVSPVMKN